MTEQSKAAHIFGQIMATITALVMVAVALVVAWALIWGGIRLLVWIFG